MASCRRVIRSLPILVLVAVLSCTSQAEEGRRLSEEELVAALKATGEFKQPNGDYAIKVKKVDGKKLIGVEMSYVTRAGGKAKLTSDLGLMKINDKGELELFFEKCEVEDGDRLLSMTRQQYEFSAPVGPAKPKP